jgi:DNA-binding NarL/FixJ family response regulator
VLDEKKHEAEALGTLSAREREVLILVVEGRTSKEVARVVGIKPTSIDTYRSRIMAKLDVPDLCGLVRFAIRHGLVKA